nr:restriction endonuclease subunit S [Thioflexithrix psekupsensis]
MFFLKLTLEKSKLADFKDNGAVPGINRNKIYSIKTTLPSLPEQQKIAACLSSLDELITAHSQKLDALKKHKKGLMQRMFPVAIDE